MSEPAGAAIGAGYLAPCPRGIEACLADELSELGASAVEVVRGGVLFSATRSVAGRAVLWSRAAVRVLEPVARGSARSFDELYELALSARWEERIGRRRTFAVHAKLSNSAMTDTRFAALRVKDAIADRIRQRRGGRPDVDRQSPDVPVRVIVRGTDVSIFRDLAGETLYHRGYRPVQVKSPLSEGVAAGLLRLTEWDRASPLLDPMCGSGTFVLEAAMMAADRAPGLKRRFAAERFPDADGRLWRRLREEAADRQRRSLRFELLGSDRHRGALRIALGAAKSAGLAGLVQFHAAEASTFEPPFEPRIVVVNPPWGERLGEGDNLAASWRALGTLLRRCHGGTAFALSGAPELTRHIGLRSDRRWPLRIGPHDARWLRYRIHRRPDR